MSKENTERTEIFKCIAGSRLFGTERPDSDTDYKAVVLPTAREILLGQTSLSYQTSTGNNKTANADTDIDVTTFSLQKYMSLLSKMETNALEMLFAPNMVGDDWVFNLLRENRFKVLTSNRDSFIGFGKSQAMRYAVRGDRLDALLEVVEVLSSINQHDSVEFGKDIFARLQNIPYVQVIPKMENGREILYLNVFGREVPMTQKAGQAIKVYQKPINEAGKRSKEASADGGPDWKGLYHAQRIVDEGIQLFSTGELTFPNPRASELLRIRNGEFPIELVLSDFEDALSHLEELTPYHEFDTTTNKEWVDEFVASIHEQIVLDGYEKWVGGN